MIYYISTLPPSVNKATVNLPTRRIGNKVVGGGRKNTDEYNYWIMKSKIELRGVPKFLYPKISCVINVPWWSHHTKGDVHNYQKAIIDIFVSSKLIVDDRHCINAKIQYVVKTDSGKIEVEFSDVTEDFKAMEEYALLMKESNPNTKEY